MTRKLDSNSKANDAAPALRRQAEAIFAAKSITSSATDLPVAAGGLSSEETNRLLHELQVHQIELELQNEELRRAQFELDGSRSRYFDLYELAPTGYCIVSEQGLIEETNLTTSKLLGVDRSRLIKQPISRFIFKEDQDRFYLNHKQILKSDEPRSYELRMVEPDGNFVWVQMACVAIEDNEGILKVRIVLSDITDRKLVEEKLRTRTAFFEAMVDSPHDGILVVDNKGKKIHQNARFLALYDIPPEIANDPDYAVQLQYVSNRTKDPQAFLDRTTYYYGHPEHIGCDEIELINGTVLERHTAPARNEHGGFYGRIWTFRDVTEQKHAQQLQAEALERLRKISSRLPGVVYQFRMRSDGSSCFPYASEGLYPLYGIQPTEVILDASPVFDRVHPDDLDELEAKIGKSSNDLSPFQCHFRLLMDDGTIRWVSANSLPEREADGSTLWHGYMTDVTESHKAAIELEAAKFQMEEAQALARMGNWSYDLSTFRIDWSKQLFTILGFNISDGEPTYQEMLDNYCPEDAAILDEAVKTAIADGTPYSLVHRIRKPQSDVRFVRGSGRARRDSAGKIVGLFGTAADVTVEVEREQALQVARTEAEAANHAKSEFLANMSHEIRTPLTAILGFADMLREDGNLDISPVERLHTIDTITTAGQHLLTIINDVLDLSKIEADKTTVERIETPLIEIVSEVERLLRPIAIGKGVTLDARLSTPVPDRILSDPTRLRQILMNLVGNAAKFTEQGSIVINASVTDPSGNACLIIDIEDTGPGMTSEQSQTLFQAFEQADTTFTRKHGGTGLGLTISRRLAKLMGGDVKLWRTELGKGSCFRLVLPMTPAVNSVFVKNIEVRPVSIVDKPHAKISVHGRILLAEDGLDNQRLLSFILKKSGASIDIADNGQIALEMWDKANKLNVPYDLLLTDMQMPVMDGYLLARSLRNRGEKMPIVALTAHALAEDRQKCLDAGCDDYLSKPIDKNSLLAVCAKWIAVRR
ncbi:MAG: PAS domain-containing protein [Planctomycetota bacterium]|nr:PAS domain-containing protein [Planctomycetota bacterium]